MKIAIGCDHAGYLVKEEIKKYMENKGFEVLDQGTYSEESCDYPIFAKKVANLVAANEVNFGILICSTGEGIAMCANKVKGCRAGIAYADDVARLIKEHNNANVIVFGAKFMALEDIKRRIDIYMAAEFLGGKHERRVNLLED